MIDLSRKVLEALTSKEPVVFPPNPSFVKKPEDAELLGHLPEHLRRLYALAKRMKKEEDAEMHRRCVEIFGREEYDNERVEFMIYNEVRADPNFAGYEVVHALLDRSVAWHFPKLPLDRFDRPRYYVDEEWGVWSLPWPKAEPKLPVLPSDIVIASAKSAP